MYTLHALPYTNEERPNSPAEEEIMYISFPLAEPRELAERAKRSGGSVHRRDPTRRVDGVTERV